MGNSNILTLMKLKMQANFENETVATGLEKVNPHPNSQEEQY